MSSQAAKPAKPAKSAAPDVPEAAAPLHDALRSWRTERARDLGKPPYVVANNRTLAAICEHQPRSEAELLDVASGRAGRGEGEEGRRGGGGDRGGGQEQSMLIVNHPYWEKRNG